MSTLEIPVNTPEGLQIGTARMYYAVRRIVIEIDDPAYIEILSESARMGLISDLRLTPTSLPVRIKIERVDPSQE